MLRYDNESSADVFEKLNTNFDKTIAYNSFELEYISFESE